MYILNNNNINEIEYELYYRKNTYSKYGDYLYHEHSDKEKHFFQAVLQLSKRKNLILLFDLDGYIVSIELSEPGRSNTVTVLRRNFNGTIYIFPRNTVNLSQDVVDFYLDYYNNFIVIDDVKAKILIQETLDIVKHIYEKGNSSFEEILKKILSKPVDLYFDPSYYLKQGYTTPLSVLPPNVRPDINHNYIVIQVTSGCKLIQTRKRPCAFCTSFDSNYVERDVNDINYHISCLRETNSEALSNAKYVFLADGDPLISKQIIFYLNEIKENLKTIQGFESFISTAGILSIEPKRWHELLQLGLRKVYWGVESANDETLRVIDKPHNLTMLNKAKSILQSMNLSYDIIVMSGIGAIDKKVRSKGSVKSNNHIRDTCDFVNNSKCDSVFISKLQIAKNSKLYTQIDNTIFPYSDTEMEEEYRTLVGNMLIDVRGAYGNQFVVERDEHSFDV